MPIRRLSIILALSAAAAGLGGCLAQHVNPPLSHAVVDARAAATRPAVCTPGGLEALSPVQVGFPYDDATMPEAGQKRLAAVAAWLKCNPGVEATIVPSADSHGDAAHLTDLAARRAQATVEMLRTLGANAVILHVTARDGADPVTGPHLLIKADGRGW